MPWTRTRSARAVTSRTPASATRLHTEFSNQLSSIEKAAYTKRLRAHLKATAEHERAVVERIGQLGGDASRPAPAVVSAVGEAAGKARAAVKGRITARTSTAEGAEAQLRIAQDQVREEHLEIALYTSIEALEEVGEAETAKLARAILRDEERAVKFLTDQLPKLVADVVRAEIPRAQRATRRRRRTRPTSCSAASRFLPSSRSRIRATAKRCTSSIPSDHGPSTASPETLAAVQDHGQIALTLDRDLDDSRQVFADPKPPVSTTTMSPPHSNTRGS
jgi:ferritin-like metal-binding protein YciE